MEVDHINPAQWQQSLGLARQTSARIFRDGGTPKDAVKAFGIEHSGEIKDWNKAVDLIAERLCATPLRRAA